MKKKLKSIKIPYTQLVSPLQRFIKAESFAGLLLMFSVLAAMILANSPYAHSYKHFWEIEFEMQLGPFKLAKSLHHWINDGLMVIFFFVIGLELKREMICGQLSSMKKAMLPAIAALGGMVVPALLYLSVNAGNTDTTSAWGVPMATDIAFVLGILALGGKHIPTSLKVFITALAIVDDLGAVLVIAFFYTSDISIIDLEIAIGFLGLMMLANALGIRNTLLYAVLGIGGVWFAFLLSGVHATIAGVLAAFTIPIRTKMESSEFAHYLRSWATKFDTNKKNILLDHHQLNAIDELNDIVLKATSPLQKLEHAMHPLVVYFVLPVFAFSNAGVELYPNALASAFSSPLLWGILIGLVVGKFLGIFMFTKIAVWTRLCDLPNDLNNKWLIAGSLLAGVGFTMSLFIAKLALTSEILVEYAKAGILAASIIAGVGGFILLKIFSDNKR